MIPEASASIFSLLFFRWIGPMLSLGFARPLDPEDLYELQDSRKSKVIADKIANSFSTRVAKAKAYNEGLVNGEISPGIRRIWWLFRGNAKERERLWRTKHGQKKASLALAMNDSVAWWFWTGGVMKCLADSSQVLSPLLVKVLKQIRPEPTIILIWNLGHHYLRSGILLRPP